MSISDEEAAAAWKKAQGQVKGKDNLAHFRPALIWFVVLFAASTLAFHFWAKIDWAPAALVAVFTSMLGTLRITLRMLRNRG